MKQAAWVFFNGRESWKRKLYEWSVVSNIFYVHPYLGKIPILTNIFQMGWYHQLDDHGQLTYQPP